MRDTESLEALAAQVDDLRGQLAQLRAQIASDGQGIAMTALLKVKQLDERLDEALEKNRVKAPPAPWWVVGEDEARAMLADLRGWVDGFARRHYPGYMDRIPRCWPNHPEAAWELSTIRAEWQRIYGDDENRSLSGALNWHDKWFPSAIARIESAIKCDAAGCRVVRRLP